MGNAHKESNSPVMMADALVIGRVDFVHQATIPLNYYDRKDSALEQLFNLDRLFQRVNGSSSEWSGQNAVVDVTVFFVFLNMLVTSILPRPFTDAQATYFCSSWWARVGHLLSKQCNRDLFCQPIETE